jgi:hypothetical protein
MPKQGEKLFLRSLIRLIEARVEEEISLMVIEKACQCPSGENNRYQGHREHLSMPERGEKLI